MDDLQRRARDLIHNEWIRETVSFPSHRLGHLMHRLTGGRITDGERSELEGLVELGEARQRHVEGLLDGSIASGTKCPTLNYNPPVQ